MGVSAALIALAAPFAIKAGSDMGKRDKARAQATDQALQPPTLPPAPDPQAEASQAASKAKHAQDLARKRSAQGGRASTLLTTDVLGAAPVARKSLLGS